MQTQRIRASIAAVWLLGCSSVVAVLHVTAVPGWGALAGAALVPPLMIMLRRWHGLQKALR